MSREAQVAASIPIGTLLVWVAIETVASRWWLLALLGIGGVSVCGMVIWFAWPAPKTVERGRRARRQSYRELRDYLEHHPDVVCPECGQVDHHLAGCPVIA